MSMTKRDFDNHFSEAEMEHHDLMWQGYDEYLYQQFAYSEEAVDDMYDFFSAQDFVAARKEEKGNDSSPLILSFVREDLGDK